MFEIFSIFHLSQANLVKETILKIEGDDISACEVAYHLDLLKAIITLRKEEKYLDPETDEEKSILVAVGQDENDLNEIFESFYGIYSSLELLENKTKYMFLTFL